MDAETETRWMEFLRTAAREVDQRELGPFDRTTRIDDLDLDSVAFMQVVAFFEDRLDRRLPHQRFARVKTVGDLFDVIAREMGGS